MKVLQCLLQVCQIPMLCIPGRVIECASDCSYLVETPTGMLRRSRSYLNIRTDEQIDAPATQGNVPPRIPIAKDWNCHQISKKTHVPGGEM